MRTPCRCPASASGPSSSARKVSTVPGIRSRRVVCRAGMSLHPIDTSHRTDEDGLLQHMFREVTMRLAAAILSALTIALPVRAQTPPVAAGQEAAVKKLFEEWDAGRNREDWKAFALCYTTDATSLSSDGSWRRGRKEIESGIAELWSKTYKGVKYRTIVESIRTLAPNAILVDATFEMTNIPGGGTRKGRVAVIVVNEGGWRIAATRNMVPVPAGASKS